MEAVEGPIIASAAEPAAELDWPQVAAALRGALAAIPLTQLAPAPASPAGAARASDPSCLESV